MYLLRYDLENESEQISQMEADKTLEKRRKKDS